MSNTRYDILVGNYGSGKTEISLNFALDAVKEGKKTVLVDLDIVNPYFRSSAKRAMLEKAGVHVISSPYANTGVDLPLVPAEVARIFTDEFDYAVVGVGGDPVGAAALGRYRAEFTRVMDRADTNFIINAHRPFTASLDAIKEMFSLIEGRSRLKMKWLINNTNLANETDAAGLLMGQKLVEDVAANLDVAVRYIIGKEKVLEDFALLSEGRKFQGVPRAIATYMRPEWLD